MALVPDINLGVTPVDPSRLTARERLEIKRRIPHALARAAQKQIEIILDRLDEGKGLKGSLKPYSPAYLKRRQARKPIDGESPKFTDPNTVNLLWSGNMRGSITHSKNTKRAKIFFSRAAEAKKAAMLNKERPFFGFTRQDEKILERVFRNYLFRGFAR